MLTTKVTNISELDRREILNEQMGHKMRMGDNPRHIETIKRNELRKSKCVKWYYIEYVFKSHSRTALTHRQIGALEPSEPPSSRLRTCYTLVCRSRLFLME